MRHWIQNYPEMYGHMLSPHWFWISKKPPPQNKSTLSLMLHRGESLVGWGVVCALSQPHSVNTDSATGGNGTTNHGSAKLIRNKGLLSKSSINWYLTVTSDIWVIEWGGLWWKNYFPNLKFIIYIYIFFFFHTLLLFLNVLACSSLVVFGLWFILLPCVFTGLFIMFSYSVVWTTNRAYHVWWHPEI